MDRKAMQWRRSFAAGFVALGLSLGGQLAFGGEAEAPACTLNEGPGLAARIAESLAPAALLPAVAQRLGHAVVGLFVHRCR